MWIIIFFVLPLAGLAYALWHIWCLLPFGAPWRGAIVAMCTLAFLTLFLNFSRLIDRLPLGLASACYETGNSSIFILLYTVMAFLLLDKKFTFDTLYCVAVHSVFMAVFFIAFFMMVF